MTSAVWGRAFTGLFARPAAVLFGLFWLGVTMSIAEYGRRSGSVLLMVASIPLPAGLIAGQVIQELQHTSIAWTLPRIRLALGSALGVVALLCAAGAAAALHLAWPAGVGLLPSALSYAAFAMLGFACGACFLNPASGWKSLTPVGVAVLVGGWAQLTIDRSGAISPLTALAAIATAAWCLSEFVSRHAMRVRLATPMLTLANVHIRNAVDRYQREKLAARPPVRGHVWRTALSHAGVAAWVRASFYARHGHRALGPFYLVVQSALAALVILVIECGMFTRPRSIDVSTALALTVLSPSDARYHFGLGFVVAVVVTAVLGSNSTAAAPAGLQPFLQYPLSRPTRARVLFSAHLAIVVIVGLTAALFFGGLGWLASRLSGVTLAAGRIPGFVPPTAFALSMLPLLLWRSMGGELSKARRESSAERAVLDIVVAIALIGATSGISGLAGKVLPSMHPALQWMLCAAPPALSLLWHWQRVRRHHERGDLI